MIYQASVRLMQQALFEGVSDIKRICGLGFSCIRFPFMRAGEVWVN